MVCSKILGLFYWFARVYTLHDFSDLWAYCLNGPYVSNRSSDVVLEAQHGLLEPRLFTIEEKKKVKKK